MSVATVKIHDESDIAVVTVEVPQQASVVKVGVPGPPGADGEGDLNYVHTQVGASAQWVVNHYLGKFPNVVVIDSGGTTVVGDVTYNSEDQLTLDFTSPFSGNAYLN